MVMRGACVAMGWRIDDAGGQALLRQPNQRLVEAVCLALRCDGMPRRWR